MAELGAFYHQIEAGVKENGLTIEESMDTMRAHGIKWADVNSQYLCEENPEEFASRLKAHGIGIISVHGLIDCDVVSEESLTKSIENGKKHMMLAKRAGSKFFMIVPRKADTYSQDKHDDYVKGARYVMKALASYGKEIGIQPTVENFSDRSFPYTSFDSIEWILNNIPDMRYTFDSGNYTIAGFNEFVGAKIFFDKTVYAHVKEVKSVGYKTDCLRDGVYYDRPVFGDGIVRNFEVIDYYLKNGYDGVFSIEYYGNEKVFDKTLLSADKIKEKFSQLTME